MCHFITLIVPSDDTEAVRAAMDRHGRAATPIDNPSVRKVLRESERQYLTTRAHCDCGTALVQRRETAEVREERFAREADRMRRKGWSEAKIERALEDRSKADSRPDPPGPDSIEFWSALLRDLGDELKLPYAGLFVHSYSGAMDSEILHASRRDMPGDMALHHALKSIEEDEVAILRLR
jgi:hypothetical protein